MGMSGHVRGTAVVLLLLGMPAAAQAQAAPRACTATNPATLANVGRSTSVSAAISTAPLTLWATYGDRDAAGRNQVTLASLSGLDGSTLTTNFANVGEGEVFANALTISSGGVFLAYQRADLKVEAFVQMLQGGTTQRAVLDASQAATSVSLMAVGARSLVGWDDTSHGLHAAWVDVAGQATAVVSVAGTQTNPIVGNGFSGQLFARSTTDGKVSVWSPTAGGAMRSSGAMTSVSSITSMASTISGRGAMLITHAGSRVQLGLLNSASGGGTVKDLGSASGTGDVSIAGVPWGAFTAWADGGMVTALPITKRGAAIGTMFPLTSSPAANLRGPAIAALGSVAVVVWEEDAGGGRVNVRFVRITCI